MNTKRTTPELITHLQPNEIFVFGSNLKGMHGGGATWIAYRKFGAIMGQGVGLQGRSYGIPTMQGGVETIRPYVDEFIICSCLLFNRLTQMNYEENFTFLPGIIALNGQRPESVGL